MKKRTSNLAPQSLAQPKGYSQQDSYLLIASPASFPQLLQRLRVGGDTGAMHGAEPQA